MHPRTNHHHNDRPAPILVEPLQPVRGCLLGCLLGLLCWVGGLVAWLLWS